MDHSFNNLNRKGNRYTDLFHARLKENGADFVTGVPCGVLKYFISNFASDPDFLHLPGQSEPECIGLAAGAYLGGMKPVVYMQNSGMLKSTNEIGSILIPCRIPVLMVVSYRGCQGEDAAQHFVTGKITKPTLEAMGIFHREIEEENVEQIVSECYGFIEDSGLPAAVVVDAVLDDLNRTGLRNLLDDAPLRRDRLTEAVSTVGAPFHLHLDAACRLSDRTKSARMPLFAPGLLALALLPAQ